jgi:hypothetical protein
LEVEGNVSTLTSFFGRLFVYMWWGKCISSETHRGLHKESFQDCFNPILWSFDWTNSSGLDRPGVSWAFTSWWDSFD